MDQSRWAFLIIVHTVTSMDYSIVFKYFVKVLIIIMDSQIIHDRRTKRNINILFRYCVHKNEK